MYRRVFVFDYDGTIAEHDRVPVKLLHALEELANRGYSLLLATGRFFQSIDLTALEEFFTGIIWENGAVLWHRGWGDVYLPFGHLNADLVASLEQAGVPLERGLATASTSSMYEEVVAQLISQSGSDAVLAHNKGALMILPPGTAKGTGLERMLELCNLSPRSVVSFGDGENDVSLFQVSEGSVTVASGVPSLQAMADLVAPKPGPAGVLDVLQRYWLTDGAMRLPAKQPRQVPLGQGPDGETEALPGPLLATQNIGVFGDSGSGKSWVTGLMVEGMLRAGYQVLLIDPEGDHRGLSSLPRVLAVNGDHATLPDPATLVLLLGEPSLSVVLDLCNYPIEKRPQYVAELAHQLLPLKRHKYRPHWIVLEESQDYLPINGEGATKVLLPMLCEGGWALVAYRPDLVAPEALKTLRTCLLTRMRDPSMVKNLNPALPLPPDEVLRNTQIGSVWLCGKQLVRLQATGRHVLHIRHLYKYLDRPLPKHKRFYFRTESGYLGIEAASLFEFRELITRLPLASLEYHQARGDFAKWVRGALWDEMLASQLDKLAHRERLKGEALRQALFERVYERYVELYNAQ